MIFQIKYWALTHISSSRAIRKEQLRSQQSFSRKTMSLIVVEPVAVAQVVQVASQVLPMTLHL